MVPYTPELYLDRLVADERLRQAQRSLLPVVLSRATMEPDLGTFQWRGASSTFETFRAALREGDGVGASRGAAIVVAPVGAGKSTLFQALTAALAREAMESIMAPLPFYLQATHVGETGEEMLVAALWRVGLPASRAILSDVLRAVERPLLFLIDPSATYYGAGASEALEQVVEDLAALYPDSRWMAALRTDVALALPSSWHQYPFYLLDPLAANTARSYLLRGLEPALRAILDRLIEEVPPLALLMRRPFVVELLRRMANDYRDRQATDWVMELFRALLERAGDLDISASALVETLHRLAIQSGDAPIHLAEAMRLAGKHLPRMHEAGLLDRLPTTEDTQAAFRFADPAWRDLILWLVQAMPPAGSAAPHGANGIAPSPEPEERVNGTKMRLIPQEFTLPTPDLFYEWTEATRSNDLTALEKMQKHLDELRAENQHAQALAYRETLQLDEAVKHAREALAIQPDNARYAITLGIINSQSGKHEEARQALEAALPHAPSGSGYYWLGKAYRALDWRNEAFQAFRQASQLDSPEQGESAAEAAALATDPAAATRFWEQAISLQPARADWQVRLGLLRASVDDRAGAKGCFERALEVNPNQAEAHYHLGAILMEQGRKEAALAHLRSATALRPKEAPWFVTLGRVLEAAGDAAAEEAYHHAMWLDPRSPDAFAALGALLRRAGRMEEAYPALKQALGLDGTQSETLLEMGMVCEAREVWSEALAAYRRAVQVDPSARAQCHLGALLRRLSRIEEARHWLESALAEDSKYGPTHDELGQLEELEGNLKEAARLYLGGLAHMPENIPLSYRAATVLFRLDRIEEAIPLLEQSVESMVDNAEAHWYLAEALRQNGRDEDAFDVYSKLVALEPDRAGYQLALARQASTLNRLDVASAAAERAIELDDNQVDAHTLMGALATERGEPTRALIAYRRAIELSPHDASLHRRMAAIYYGMGRFDEALNYQYRTLELVGENAPLLSEIAALHEARGNLEAATGFLNRALKVDPQALDIRLNRARLLTASGQTELARRDWESVLRADSSCGEAHFGLANLLRDEGKREEALDSFERALSRERAPAEWLMAHSQLAIELGRCNGAISSLERVIGETSADLPPTTLAQAHHELAKLTGGVRAMGHAVQASTLDPTNPYYYVTLAELQAQANMEEAWESFEMAHRLAPQDADILERLGRYHEDRGSMWDACDCYQRAAQHAEHPAPLLFRVARLKRGIMHDLTGARQSLQEAIRAEPTYAPAYRELADLALEVGQTRAAEPLLRRALTLDPDDVRSMVMLGELLTVQGQELEARELLQRGVKLEPNNHRMHFLLGKIAHNHGEATVALREWEQAVEQAASNGEYQRHLGIALAALGRITEARHAWARALDLNPSDGESHYLLGQSALKQQQATAAIQAFRAAVTADPKRPAYHEALGEALIAVGQWDGALASLRAARDLDNQIPSIHHLMAQCYEHINLCDEALEQAREAVQLAPQEPVYARALADLCVRRGEWAAAAAMYRRALELQPDDSSLFVALGRCEHHAGAFDSAAVWFRKAIEADPQAPLPHHLLAQSLCEAQRPYFLAELVRAEIPGLHSTERAAVLQEALNAARTACSVEGRNPAYQATLAQLLIMADEPDAALILFRQVAEPAEQRAVFQTLAGLANLRRGDGRGARTILDQVTRLDANEPVRWLALASAAEMSDDVSSALAAVERAQALVPGESLVHFAIARLSLKMGDVERARREIERAIELRGNVASWYHLLGQICLSAGDTLEALQAFDEALKLSGGEAAATRFARGQVLGLLGRPTEAIREMERAVEQQPEEPEWQSELAAQLMKVERWDEAQNWLRSAIGASPDRARYALQLAQAQASNEEHTAAIATLETCRERWPNEPSILLLLGQLLRNAEDLPGARAVLEEVLALTPEDPAAHVALGTVLQRLGDTERARAHFNTALTIEPGNPDAHIYLGRLLEREGKLDAALASYNAALKQHPDELRALYYLGRLYQRQGHLVLATKHLEHLTTLAPNNHRAWAALADCYEVQDNLPVALQHFTTANEVAAGRAYYLFHMGRLLKDMRQYQEARSVLRQAVKAEPDRTEAFKLLAAVSAITFLGGRS